MDVLLRNLQKPVVRISQHSMPGVWRALPDLLERWRESGLVGFLDGWGSETLGRAAWPCVGRKRAEKGLGFN